MANLLSTIGDLWRTARNEFVEHPMYEEVLQKNGADSLIVRIVAKDGRKYVTLKIEEWDQSSSQIRLELQTVAKLHQKLARYLSDFKKTDLPDD